MKWDAKADQSLLLAILSTHRITVDYTRVAAALGCTPRACEERIKKLRKAEKLNPQPSSSSKRREEEEDKPMIARRRKVDERKAYARTKEGNEIPLDVPLEVAGTPVVGGRWWE
ncbi:hypothetical protein K440DRAFT_645579 [Wilcoxina mikolae CBS 423.85]|nr:hypothetical protein K440DRAFT_645579 [Wilcoxina mikolae CBS 423.85]